MNSEEMQTEIEKRIEEAAYSYDIPRHFNCYGCCQSDSDYEKAFKAGAKFILEMPEMNTIRNSIVEIHNLLLNYYSEPEVYWNEPDLAFIKTKELLEALKKAGLCE